MAADDCESNRESEDAAAMSAKVSALLELATASVAMVVFGDVACVPLLPLLLQRAESAAPPLALAGKGCVSETTPGRAMSMRCCCGAEHITLGSHSWTTIGLSICAVVIKMDACSSRTLRECPRRSLFSPAFSDPNLY